MALIGPAGYRPERDLGDAFTPRTRPVPFKYGWQATAAALGRRRRYPAQPDTQAVRPTYVNPDAQFVFSRPDDLPPPVVVEALPPEILPQPEVLGSPDAASYPRAIGVTPREYFRFSDGLESTRVKGTGPVDVRRAADRAMEMMRRHRFFGKNNAGTQPTPGIPGPSFADPSLSFGSEDFPPAPYFPAQEYAPSMPSRYPSMGAARVRVSKMDPFQIPYATGRRDAYAPDNMDFGNAGPSQIPARRARNAPVTPSVYMKPLDEDFALEPIAPIEYGESPSYAGPSMNAAGKRVGPEPSLPYVPPPSAPSKEEVEAMIMQILQDMEGKKRRYSGPGGSARSMRDRINGVLSGIVGR